MRSRVGSTPISFRQIFSIVCVGFDHFRSATVRGSYGASPLELAGLFTVAELKRNRRLIRIGPCNYTQGPSPCQPHVPLGVQAGDHQTFLLDEKPKCIGELAQIRFPGFLDALLETHGVHVDPGCSLAHFGNKPIAKALFLILVPVICSFNICQSRSGVFDQ